MIALQVVGLCAVGDRSIGKVAKDLGLTETAVREWVRLAEIDEGKGPPGALTTEEREELRHLRRENKRLEMERSIFKKAAAGSTGQRNSFVQFLCGGLIPQGLPRSLVQAPSDLV